MMLVRRKWRWGQCPPPGAPGDLGLHSDHVIEEHALLIVRGVRPLAIVGGIDASPHTMWYTHLNLRGVASRVGGEVVPYVVELPGSKALYGFAAAPWAVELLWFAYARPAARHKDRIVGLLLGYSAAAIQRYSDAGAILSLGARRHLTEPRQVGQ